MKKISLPKVNLKAFDWSKWNFRKINRITILSLLAYVNFLVIFPLFLGKDSSFVTFHARQGVALLVVWILFSFSFYVPILPWIIALFMAVCFVIGIVNVVSGHERALPLIGKFAK